MERDFVPDDTQFELPILTDEDEALRSLDDTTYRPLPEMTAGWEALDPQMPEEPRRGVPSARLKTGVLVGAVAVVSFVAGGLTARLSSQVPVLFAERPERVETPAAFEEPQASDEQDAFDRTESPVTTPAPQQQDGVQDVPAPPAYDTGYDTTEDAPDGMDEDVPESTTGDAPDEVTDDTQAPIEYDDTSFVFTFEDLLSNKDELYRQYRDYDLETDVRRRYDLNGGTGDDATDAERDSWGWHGLTGNTYDYHT